MLLSMSRVQIVGSKRLFYDTLNVVHYLGVLQIEDLSKKISPGDMLMRRMEVDEEAQRGHAQLERLLGQISSILTTVKPEEQDDAKIQKKVHESYDVIWRSSCEDLATDCTEIIKKLTGSTRDMATHKEDLERELASLLKYETIVKKLYPLAPQLYRLEGFEAVALLINKKYGAVLDLIRSEIGKITKKQFELISAEVDEDTIAAIILFKKAYSAQVHNFLWAEKVNQVRLPESLADKPFDEILDHIKARKTEIPMEVMRIREKLDGVAEKWYVRLLVLKQAVRDKLDELEMPAQLGQTDFTFVINGWVPTKYMDKLRNTLNDEFGGKVHIEELPLTQEAREEAPVVFENPWWVKPFELVMHIWPPPRYGTIDPTPFVAIFFPAFFGMIVGDIGIGAILLLAAIFLRWKYRKLMPWVDPVSQIFIMGSISAIIFGFIYGELFGNVLELNHLIREIHILGVKLPLNRLEMIIPMLGLCVAVGAVQVILGLILGVINAVREKAQKHVIEKIGMLVVLFAILVIVAAIAMELKVLMTPAFVAIWIGLILLVYGGGFMGIIEVFGTLANIFSYLRILAIGLAGAILAMVANELIGSMGSIYIGITVALLLHGLNIALAVFSPTIHSLRLNFIEFFKQFVETGGQEYHPFKRIGGD